ncbi:hypothetical protein EMIT0P44_190086 [Pseudomonas sp. IT-P44]
MSYVFLYRFRRTEQVRFLDSLMAP